MINVENFVNSRKQMLAVEPANDLSQKVILDENAVSALDNQEVDESPDRQIDLTVKSADNN